MGNFRWMGLILLTWGIPLLALCQPDADPSRFYYEDDWVTWKAGVKYPDRVEKLYIAEQESVDFETLKSFTHLKGLIIRNTPLKDLTFFEHHPEITIVELHGNSLKTLEGVQHITKVKELAVAHNFVEDLSPLSGLDSLVELKLYDNEIIDLEPLRGMSHIKMLDLAKNKFTTLEPICDFTNLTSFSVFDCPNLRDVNCIVNFINLTFLNISKLEIPHFSLALITHMDSLDNLRIQGMVKDSKELNFIKHMTEMEQLTMGRNPGVDNIDSLKYMTKLEYLDIHGNDVEDISIVYYFPKLAKLVCYNNRIKHIEVLEPLTELKALFIHNNPIENFEPMYEMIQLQYLNLSKDQLTPEVAKELRKYLPDTKISLY